MLYFAYGSNLLPARLLERTPSARTLGVGVLAGHGLRWHMASADGSGKCDVVADAAATVQGVVWRLDPAEWPRLDDAESYGTGYTRRVVAVATAAGKVEAWTYTALRTDPKRLPYDWYRDIVAAGARAQGLAAAYVDALAQTAAQPDADAARAARHRALLLR